jgi:hypothetical protein
LASSLRAELENQNRKRLADPEKLSGHTTGGEGMPGCILPSSGFGRQTLDLLFQLPESAHREKG